METELIKIYKIKGNPKNPRIIKDDKFHKLVKSIKEFPKMLELRPIVVNSEMVVLGGNMRLKACKEAGLKDVPTIKAIDLTEEQQNQFIIKDNVGFGEWDWDVLSSNWDADELQDWGLDYFDVDIDEENINDIDDENLPEYIAKDNPLQCIMSFETETDKEEFLKIIGTPYKDVLKIKSLWFPHKEREINNDKFYTVD